MTQVPIVVTNEGGVPAYNYKDVPLRVDVTPTIGSNGRVLVNLRFNYGSISAAGAQPRPGNAVETPRPAFGEITEDLAVLVSHGTPLVVARSADATSDRTVTVEVKAEILK